MTDVPGSGAGLSRCGADIQLRQIQSERAARSNSAAQLDLSAQQAGQFPADRQTESRAAILSAGACVGLLERFKNDALLFRRNPDAGVGHLKRNDRLPPC